jgi:hypothetical protein
MKCRDRTNPKILRLTPKGPVVMDWAPFDSCPETSLFCFETKGEVEEFENSGKSTQSTTNPPWLHTKP